METEVSNHIHQKNKLEDTPWRPEHLACFIRGNHKALVFVYLPVTVGTPSWCYIKPIPALPDTVLWEISIQFKMSTRQLVHHIFFTSVRPSWNDEVIKWEHFPRYWPFVRGIHRSPVNSTHKGQWRRALMFSLICVWINGWVNNPEAGDLRRHRAHCVVIVMETVILRTQFVSNIPFSVI